MTRTEIERLAVVESKIDGIESTVARMEAKLDDAIVCKADKTALDAMNTELDTKASAEDFKELRRLIITVGLTVVGFLSATLIGIVLFRIGLNS